MREISLEKQIKSCLKNDKIDYAFKIINDLEYNNMEKFLVLESFYCDFAWYFFYKKSEEGYKEAEKHFNLCNYNTFELIYHFIQLLKIKPIHEGFENFEKLSKEIKDNQISDNVETPIIEAALDMLINILQSKKSYLLSLIENEQNQIIDIEKTKNKNIIFESSQYCVINLKDKKPQNIRIYDVIKMINEVIVKGMVLLKKDISSIESFIEND